MDAGSVVTDKLVAALKQVGFDYVFDTAVGADFTTIEESEELIDRLKNKTNLPAFTSCCPAWVSLLKQIILNFFLIYVASSLHKFILGEIIKKFWNKDAFVVSIMPCTAKSQKLKKNRGGRPRPSGWRPIPPGRAPGRRTAGAGRDLLSRPRNRFSSMKHRKLQQADRGYIRGIRHGASARAR